MLSAVNNSPLGNSNDRVKRLVITELVVFTGLLSLMLLVYSPVLFITYGFTDDFSLLGDSILNEYRETSIFQIGMGRPLNALIHKLVLSIADNIQELAYVRLLAIAGIATIAWSLYRTFMTAGWPRIQAIPMAVIICCMPPYQLSASWATTFPRILAVLLAIGAFQIISNGFSKNSFLPKILSSCAGVAVLVIASTIYQPDLTFFLVPMAIILFIPSGQKNFGQKLKFFLCCIIVFTVGLGLAYVTLKILTYYSPSHGTMRTALTIDIVGKIGWYLSEPLRASLNLISLKQSTLPAVLISLFICTGLLLYYRGNLKERLGMLMLAILLVPLSYLPNLLVAENWGAYRTQLSMTTLITIYFLFSVHGWLGHLPFPTEIQSAVRKWGSPFFMGLLALVACFSASYHVTVYFALPGNIELRFLKSQLVQTELSAVKRILVIRPDSRDSIAPGITFDEFGLLSTYPPWTPEPMIRLMLRDMNLDYMKVEIKSCTADELVDTPEGTMVIDMRNINKFKLQDSE
jgi:hypothetical protein